MTTLHLKRGRENRIKQGHLWAFAGEINESLKELEPGAQVSLCLANGKLIGRGYVNPHSLIAVRLMTRGEEVWDEQLFSKRIAAAQQYRTLMCPDWEAYRLIYGESDGLPGLVVDNYNKHLILQSLTNGIEQRLDQIVAALVEQVQPKSIFLKGQSHFRKLEGLPVEDRVLYGDVPDSVNFREGETQFAAHPRDGQKTGFFLDQRSNRQLISSLVKNKKVLDLYCYTGAWGVSSLVAGAAAATFVDSSQKALDRSLEHAVLNRVEDRSLHFKADALDFMNQAALEKQQYDLVILDPPALIPSRSALKQGQTLYRTINQIALKLVKPGGFLVSCSCSHLLGSENHLQLLGEAALRVDRKLKLVFSGMQAPDHPILPGHPETQYLKCRVIYCY